MIMKKEHYEAVIKEQKKDIARAKAKIKKENARANAKARSFQKERKKQMDLAYRIIKPCINYDQEYDILYIRFGGTNKVESTIELTSDLRVDISKKGIIVAIEICNFSDYQKRNSFK